MHVGNSINLLIEGKEKIYFKNQNTGKTGRDYNLYYVGDLNGCPLVALRSCCDKKFRCQVSKNGRAVWKDSIQGFGDLWILKKAEYTRFFVK